MRCVASPGWQQWRACIDHSLVRVCLWQKGWLGSLVRFSVLFSRKHGCWLFNFFLSIEMPFGHRFLGKECFHFSWFLCDVCVCWNRTNKAGMLFAWKISSYLLSIVSGGQTLIPVAIFFNIYSAVMPQIYVWIVLCMICEIHFFFIIDRLRPELSIKVM